MCLHQVGMPCEHALADGDTANARRHAKKSYGNRIAKLQGKFLQKT